MFRTTRMSFLLDIFRRAHRERRHTAMAIHTEVVLCQPSSISFTDSGIPSVSDNQSSEGLQKASKLLHDLQCVAFPTETVYGLGALALDETAASRIFSTKGRPPDNPLIVHVSSPEMLTRLLPKDYTPSPLYRLLMRRFWPGALTLLFPTDGETIPSIITAGQPTVAIRMPSHPVARALIAVADSPIAAPSANSSGKPSPTRAEHVFRDLEGKIALVLDGGACNVGLESTVVDGLHADGNLRVLRPGGITVEELEAAICDEMNKTMEEAPTTPGMKYRHYSPAVPVTLIHTLSPPPNNIQRSPVATFIGGLKQRHPTGMGSLKVGLLMPSDSALLDMLSQMDGIVWVRYPLGPLGEPSISAQRLFDGLLTLEKEDVDLILIEEMKEEREGLAVMNRVKKAAGEFI
ncbi:DHBP synthase RibB-like alpha/beta domain-containing protein [Cristinia sonorae]|uniref:Threonylcarbamoyl-AMP synthase n=1 Tax=Cristinia sonorae TaxID=1940300 RepID=A0A8K0XUA3_9AGAR|nr:DHBP synthase RibB-like alpha/beta domain-containing protein [Cristinia sonorae]